MHQEKSMEWPWLKGWWRLKRFAHPQLRHSHEDIYYGHASDEEEDDDDDDICYCDNCLNVGFFLFFNRCVSIGLSHVIV